MIPVQFDYLAPKSLEEAIKLLSTEKVVIGGGHRLIAALKEGRASPSLLVDLLNLSELKGISFNDKDTLEIGAMTPYSQIVASAEIQQKFPALAQAAGSIGDAQIRNWERIGDIFAYQDLASDVLAVMLALEATVQTTGIGGPNTLSAEELLQLALKTEWMPREIVLKIQFPAYFGVNTYLSMRNPASNLAICAIVAQVSLSDNLIHQCRVAVAGVSSYPIRLRDVETAMEGRAPTAENIATAAACAKENLQNAVTQQEGLTLLEDLYAKSDYRLHLAGVLTKRALTEAIQKSRGGVTPPLQGAK